MISEQRKPLCHVHRVYEILYADRAPPCPIRSSDLVRRLAAVGASFSLIHGQFYVLSPRICYVFMLLPRDCLQVTVKGAVLHQTELSADGARFSSLCGIDVNVPTAGPEPRALQRRRACAGGSSADHRQFVLHV